MLCVQPTNNCNGHLPCYVLAYWSATIWTLLICNDLFTKCTHLKERSLNLFERELNKVQQKKNLWISAVQLPLSLSRSDKLTEYHVVAVLLDNHLTEIWKVQTLTMSEQKFRLSTPWNLFPVFDSEPPQIVASRHLDCVYLRVCIEDCTLRLVD